MISRPGAGNVKKLPLGVVDLFEIGLVSDGFDALLRGYDLVVAGHHRDRTEFETFSQMHRANAEFTSDGLHTLVEHPKRNTGVNRRSARSTQLRRGANEDADFMGRDCVPDSGG